jgi:pyridoxine 4-dehydrogenase
MADAASIDEIRIADMSVRRFGLGTAPFTGPGVWDYPADRAQALRVFRRAIELGVNFIDTADSYGPHVAEELLCEALHPYPKDLVISCKIGQVRAGPHVFVPLGRPEWLRHACDMTLRRLRRDQLDICHLHRIDAKVPFEEQVGALVDLQKAGKIRHIGASNVSVEQLAAFRRITPVVTVQVKYNVLERENEPLLRICERDKLVFLPWFPLGNGEIVKPGGPLEGISRRTAIAPAQLAIAWLRARSSALLPIPGAVKVSEIEENIASTRLKLEPGVLDEITALVG